MEKQTMPGAASAGTGTGSSAGSRRVGPAGGCLSPGRWNLPAPLGVWGRGAEFTTVTVLSEKPSKDVGSLEAMSVSHPLAVGRHVEF